MDGPVTAVGEAVEADGDAETRDRVEDDREHDAGGMDETPHSSRPSRPSATNGRTTITAVTVTYSRSPPARTGAGPSVGEGDVPS